MQRAKLKAQKAAKPTKQKALPPKGKSSAGSSKARYQRGVRRDAMAKKQLENFGRAFKKTLKQGAAQDKLNKAAKGTKGTKVRTGQAAPGKLAKRPSSAIVKSSSGKATTSSGAGKPGNYYGKGPRGMRTRLPEGKKGGALAKNRGLGKGGIGTAAAQTAGMYLAGKMAETIGKKGQSKMSKFGITSKSASKSKSKPAASKPKMKPSPGMSKGAVAAAKKGAAAANKAKSSVKSPVSPKKVSKGVSTPKAKAKAPVAPSRRPSAAPKPKTTSGKKNAYRVPQGAERKDRMSKVVKELREMRERSRKRQGK